MSELERECGSAVTNRRQDRRERRRQKSSLRKRIALGLAGCFAGLMQTYFPDGSRYCGIGVFARPDGFGVYTLPAGERLFGIWDFTEDLEYVMNGETYRYVGMLRSGQPHGYGVLADSGGNRCFAGEFRDGAAD